MSNKRNSLIICIVLACAIAALLDCAGLLRGQYGRMDPNDEITRLFETYQIRPNSSYYYSGAESYPNAILGLDKKHPLATNLWKPFEASPTNLKPFIVGMKLEVLKANQLLHGFVILDSEGNTIGIWFSLLNARQPVVIHDDGTIDVYTPDPDTYGITPLFKPKLN